MKNVFIQNKQKISYNMAQVNMYKILGIETKSDYKKCLKTFVNILRELFSQLPLHFQFLLA